MLPPDRLTAMHPRESFDKPILPVKNWQSWSKVLKRRHPASGMGPARQLGRYLPIHRGETVFPRLIPALLPRVHE